MGQAVKIQFIELDGFNQQDQDSSMPDQLGQALIR
jgi:hypothetical protein